MNVVRELLKIMLETIQETGTSGAPLGPMYAAMMSTGMTLEQFNAIISCMTDTGMIRVSNHVAYSIR